VGAGELPAGAESRQVKKKTVLFFTDSASAAENEILLLRHPGTGVKDRVIRLEKILRTGPSSLSDEEELTNRGNRITMYDMKTAILTIRLDEELNRLLTKASRRSGKNRSEIAREALRRQLRLEQFEELRKRIMPFAEARGYLTDEDIFSEIS